MGMFLSLSGIIGKTSEEVITSLQNYVKSVNGGLEEASVPNEHPNFCVVDQLNNNTTILYPYQYVEWDASSEYISRELQTTVFSCHIHDGDLWMFVLFNNGKAVAQFNPIPEYWDDSISQEEIDNWKGNAEEVIRYVPGLRSSDIEKYFKYWDIDESGNDKAYQEDEFPYGDCWQLVDFMRRVGLSYPIDNAGNPKGQIFKLWTNQHRLQEPRPKKQHSPIKNTVKETTPSEATKNPSSNTLENKKPWWKIW